jgi:tRNA A-37 threonylcarbamoyl transferase component Bud32
MSAERHLRLVETGENPPQGLDALPPMEDRPPSLPPPDPLIGRTLDGRYRVESVLGEGGMGLVYRAKHAVLGKSLAIKVLRSEVSKDQEVMQRFQQEAQSASAIGNQHIIDISDFGSLPDGSTYFVMEFLDGYSLTHVIEQGRMPPERVIHVARQLCEALGAAHERSIVHRDLKPDNIYLVKRGSDHDFVKVLDFGIAKVGGASSKLTKAGQVFGTPHYMSPEQCAGANLDHRTDVYAVGVILYEMACGRVPFDADNLMGILTKHMYEQPIPPHELPPPVDVPPGLEAVILRCLAKSADARYQNMAELKDDLDRLMAGTTPEAVIHAVNRASNTQTGLRNDGTGRMSALQVGRGVGAMEEAPPAPSRLPLILGGVVVLALLGGGGAFWAMSQGPTVAVVTPPTIAGPPGETTGAGATAAGGTGAEAGGTEAIAGAIGAPPPVEVPPVAGGAEGGTAVPAPVASVMIISDPAGAEVLLNGAVMGNTPLAVPRPSGSEIVNLTLRLPGYAERGVAVTAVAAAEMNVALTARRRSSGGGGSASSGGSGTAAAGTGTTAPPVETPPVRGGGTTGGRSSAGGDGVINPWGD